MAFLSITHRDFQLAVERLLSQSSHNATVDFALFANTMGQPSAAAKGYLACNIGRESRPAAAKEATGILRAWTFTNPEALLPIAVGQLLNDNPHSLALGIGSGPMQGHALCLSSTAPDANLLPIRTVSIIGAGMVRIDCDQTQESVREMPLRWLTTNGLYSRVIGTLGIETFARLQRGNIAIVGCGGSGSLIASGLARLMGREGRLTLIDPDRIEMANLPNWAAIGVGSPESLIGRFKSEALAEYLQRLPDPPETETLCTDAADWRAQCALRRCDALICCVDNPTARFAVAFIAAIYLRPLLDLGTGVSLPAGVSGSGEPAGGNRLYKNAFLPPSLTAEGGRMGGADVRLIVPGRTGEPGNCLLCQGGVGDLERVRRDFNRPLSENASRTTSAFWRERAGSLWTVNSEAASMAQRQWIGFVSGVLATSRHWQMNQQGSGPPQWKSIVHRLPATCPLCLRAGQGDSAWDERLVVLEEMRRAVQK